MDIRSDNIRIKDPDKIGNVSKSIVDIIKREDINKWIVFKVSEYDLKLSIVR